MTESNKELLVDFIEEIWNKGKIQNIGKFINFPYMIHRDPGDPWEGKLLDDTEFQKRLLYSRGVFPDLHFTIKHIVADGDKVTIGWHFQGTQKGDIPGFLPATGKSVTVSGLTIYFFENNKITGHWQIVDSLGLIRQLESGS